MVMTYRLDDLKKIMKDNGIKDGYQFVHTVKF